MDDAASLDASPADLATLLAGRLCHDFISPASAIASGLDLLEDPSAQDMREDAMGLITQSARKLVDLLQFSRVAFGTSTGAETFDTRDLEALAQGVFAHVRPALEWSVEPPALEKPAAKVLLNLAQVAAGALPAGGLAKVRAVAGEGRLAITIEAAGPRARLRQEVLDGLKGQPLGEGGLGGHWVQAYFLHLLFKEAGGQVGGEAGEEQVTLAGWMPL